MKNIEEVSQSQKELLILVLKNHPAICDILVHFLNNKMKSLNYLIKPTKHDGIFQITSDNNIFLPYKIYFTQHELRISLDNTNSKTKYYAFNKRSTRLNVSYKLKKNNHQTNPRGTFGQIEYGIGTIISENEYETQKPAKHEDRCIRFHEQLIYKTETKKGNNRVCKIFYKSEHAKLAIQQGQLYPHLHMKAKISYDIHGNAKVLMRNVGNKTLAQVLDDDKTGVRPLSTADRWKKTFDLLYAATTQIPVTHAHLDLKPENVLENKDGRLQIADVDNTTEIGLLADAIGTVGYIAPKIIRLIKHNKMLASELVMHLYFANKAYDDYALGQIISEIWGAQSIYDVIDYIGATAQQHIAYSEIKQPHQYRCTAMAIWADLKRPACGSELFSGMNLSDDDKTVLLNIIDGLMGPNDKNQRLSAANALSKIQEQYSKWQNITCKTDTYNNQTSVTNEKTTEAYNFLNGLKNIISQLTTLNIINSATYANKIIERCLHDFDNKKYNNATFMRTVNNIACIIRPNLASKIAIPVQKTILNLLFPTMRIQPDLYVKIENESPSLTCLLLKLKESILSDVFCVETLNKNIIDIQHSLKKPIIIQLRSNKDELIEILKSNCPKTSLPLQQKLIAMCNKAILILIRDGIPTNRTDLLTIEGTYKTMSLFLNILNKKSEIDYIDCEPEYELMQLYRLITTYKNSLGNDMLEDTLKIVKELIRNKPYNQSLQPLSGNKYHNFAWFKEVPLCDGTSSNRETEYLSDDESDTDKCIFPYNSL